MAKKDEKAPKNQAPADLTFVLVANQHTGPILLPRAAMQGAQRIALPPIELLPGTITKVDKAEWEDRVKLPVIQHWLDCGILAIANVVGVGQVPVMGNTSTNLEDAIPENLKTEEELGNMGTSAKVTKAQVGSVEI